MSASSSRRGVWITLGAICIVGGVVAAALLWIGASQRRDSAIENLARAPIGCDTTLDFIEPGEYLLFVETAGNLDGVRGDCNIEGAYGNAGQLAPDVEVTLVDPDGNEVDVNRSFVDVDYDSAGFSGTARFSVDIATTDDHRLRAESDADGVVVVAVGRDPSEGVAALRIGAIAAGALGAIVGLALVLLGARKSSAAVPAGPWTPGVAPGAGTFVPGGLPPQGPPVYGQPGGPPQYGHQPSPPQQRPAPYGLHQPPAPQPPAPQPQQFQQPPAAQPNIPGQPTFPQAPADPAGSAQPIDWAPRPPTPPPQNPPPQSPPPQNPPPPHPHPVDTAHPDAEFPTQQREERATQERPAPPPPE